MQKKVLILGGEQYKMLAVARALHSEGIFVGVASKDKHALSFYSKSCGKKYLLTENWLEEIKKILLNEKYELLIPAGEHDKLRLILNRKFFDKYCILPSEKSMKIASSKAETMKLAEKLGVLIPKSVKVENIVALDNLKNSLNFPILLKPSTLDSSGPRPKYIFDNEKFLEEYEKYSKVSESPLVQEVIIGDGFGTFLLCDKGKVLQYFCHKRVIEQDPLGSGSARCASCVLNEELKTASEKIAKVLKWSGEIMLEFKQDAKTKKFYLIEINPRFWGSLPLAIHCGVNFPYLLYKLKKGLKIKEKKVWENKESRYLFGELIYLARVMKGRPSDWQLYFPSRIQALRKVFVEGKFRNFFVISAKDFKPFMFDILRNFKKLK